MAFQSEGNFLCVMCICFATALKPCKQILLLGRCGRTVWVHPGAISIVFLLTIYGSWHSCVAHMSSCYAQRRNLFCI